MTNQLKYRLKHLNSQPLAEGVWHRLRVHLQQLQPPGFFRIRRNRLQFHRLLFRRLGGTTGELKEIGLLEFLIPFV